MGCPVCDSPRVAEMEADLRARVPVRAMAVKYGIPKSTISKHRTRCMVMNEVRAVALQRMKDRAYVVPDSAGLIKELLDLKGVIQAHFEAAVAAGRPLPLVLVREMRSLSELLLKSVLMIEQREAAEDDLKPFLARLKGVEDELERLEGGAQHAIAKLDA